MADAEASTEAVKVDLGRPIVLKDGEIRFKPLEWQVGVANGEETHFADTVLGRYAVWIKDDKAIVMLPSGARYHGGVTLDEAKGFVWDRYRLRLIGTILL